jgi:hypothetical protein
VFPPDVNAIVKQLRERFRAWVTGDETRAELPDLLSAEELVTGLVRDAGLGMLQDFVDVRAEQALEHREPCKCGRRKEVLRSPSWPRKTLLGTVHVRDAYTYCRTCQESEKPLQAWLGTDRETWSLLAQEAAVDLATDESCEKAVAKLARHHPGVEMGRTTALRLLHEHGGHARKFVDTKLSTARKAAERPSTRQDAIAEELEVEFDGGMIPVATLEPIAIEEGKEPARTPVRGLLKRRKVCRWEEVKAGLVQKPGEVDRLYSLRPTAGLDAAFGDLFGLAVMKGWTKRTQVRGIADGARHIRPRMAEAFHAGTFRFILDRPHCKEHLSSAGAALEPATGLPAQEWATSALARLETGRAEEVVSELARAWEALGDDEKSRDDTLRREAVYFERNKDAVAYAEYRENGWSTASSEIESCHGHLVQARMKIGGAWWHPDGVDDVLALRLVRANGWWEEFWTDQRRTWRSRAATFAEARPSRAA